METWSIIAEPSSCPACDRARLRERGMNPRRRRADGKSYELLPLPRRAGAHELVDDRVHQRLERGVDDVGRDADRGPALSGLVLALDQDARHRLGAARPDREPGRDRRALDHGPRSEKPTSELPS